MKIKPRIAICAFELSGQGPEVQLLPAGTFRAKDGRPDNAPHWKLDATIAERVIAASSAANALVIDYEHQTLNSDKNGQAAPAAGWFEGSKMVFKEGIGLFATGVKWTEKARQMIEADEYRYISAVFAFEPGTGLVKRIFNAALTNNPALEGMQEVESRAAAKFLPNEEDSTVELLIAICKALGLDEKIGETEAVNAVVALKSKCDGLETTATDLAKALGLDKDKVDAKQITDAVAALKSNTGSGDVDLSQYAPIETMKNMQSELAALKGTLNDRDVDDLVNEAMSDGKLLPAQEKWARDLGKKDIAALKDYLKDATSVAALKGRQTDTKHQQLNDKGEVTLTDDQVAICKSMNISQDEYKKTLAADLKVAS